MKYEFRSVAVPLVSVCCLLLWIGCASTPSPVDAPSATAATRDAAHREGGQLPGGGTVEARALSSAARFRATPYQKRWYGNAVMYEVMVRSFADSDGDGIGDLKGLIQRLDYLNTGVEGSTADLKVDALWLMPIFVSPSYHGYDASDYYAIDPTYGTMADFHALVEAAHARGVRILLDLVLNHTSNVHPWFQRSAAGETDWRDWYVWGKEDPGWVRPWGGGPVWHKRGPAYYYGLFWEGMPDLNYRHPAVQDEMIAVGKFWLEQGADGYRLDAIRYLFEAGKEQQADLPETLDYLRRFAAEMRSVKPDVALVGEIWSDTTDVAPYFGDGDILDLAFGFDEAGSLLEAVKTGTAAPLAEALNRVAMAFEERGFSAPFLTNHDMPRLATLLEGSIPAQKLASALLLSLPGTPFLYQGEEIGLENGSRPGDHAKRTPMQWDGSPNAGFTTGTQPWNALSGHQDKVSVAAEAADPTSLLSWYRRMIRLRRASPGLRHGDIGAVTTTSKQPGLLHFLRVVKGEIMVCLFNLGSSPISAPQVVVPQDWLEKAGMVNMHVVVTTISLDENATTRILEPDHGLSVVSAELDAQQARWIRIVSPGH